MQSNQKVIKFEKSQDDSYNSKRPRGKYNKTLRGGGVKGDFRNMKGDSLINQERYIDYKEY